MQSTEEILRLKHLFWYDRMIQRTGTDPEISHQINERLRQTLRGLPQDKEVIVTTHFVPKATFIVKTNGEVCSLESFERVSRFTRIWGSY